MENTREKTNACPVCDKETKEDESMIYCITCGFNVKKTEIHPKQNAV